MRNIETAQKYLSAVYAGDIPAATALLDPTIRLEMNGNNVLSGTYTGTHAFFATFGEMMALTGNTYKMEEAIEWLEGEERAVLFALESAEKDGKKYVFQRVIDYQIQNEKIVAIKIYEGEPLIADMVFSG